MKQLCTSTLNNIVHRDIKPENILINTQNYDIKLIDFSSSQQFDPNVKIKSACGTLYYMAPEVLMIDYDEK